MKTALIILALLASGCTSKTEFGNCIGIADDRDPKLNYKMDIWNAGLGILFVEFIIPPIIVVADEFYCPVGVK
jgi:hypothetical protein